MKIEQEKEIVYLLKQGCSPEFIQKVLKKKHILVSKSDIILIAKKYKLKIVTKMDKTEYVKNQMNVQLNNSEYLKKIKFIILLFFIFILLSVILLGVFVSVKVALITLGVIIVLITCLCIISYFKFYKK